MRNFVHKASVEINKPKVFRDRSKEYKNRTLKYEDCEMDHPAHKPYKRTDWDEDMDDEDDEQEPEESPDEETLPEEGEE
jgi:hypothetical protein